jgi:hypothetical protein
MHGGEGAVFHGRRETAVWIFPGHEIASRDGVSQRARAVQNAHT